MLNSKAVLLTTAETCPTPQRKALCRVPHPPLRNVSTHVEGTSHTQVWGCSYTVGQTNLYGCLRMDHHSAFSLHNEGVAFSPTCLTCLSGSLPSPDICFSPPISGLRSPPPLPPPPARFLLPHPAVRSESCAYDTSVCCHGNRGGLRLERRDQAPPLPELPPQLVPAGREQLASGTKARQRPGRGKGQGNPSGAPQLAHWDFSAKRHAEVGSRG